MEEEHTKKIRKLENTISNNKRIVQKKKKSLRYIVSGIFLFYFGLYLFAEEYLYSYFGGRIEFIKAMIYAFIGCSFIYTIWLFLHLKRITSDTKKLNEKMYHLMKLKTTD
jgi:hypothetical protein